MNAKQAQKQESPGISPRALENYDLLLRHSLAGGIVFLSVALDVENAVLKDFLNLYTLYIALYILDTFCRIELDDVRFIKRPEGGIVGVG